MNFVAPFAAMLQVIAAFLIFVASYLALALSVIIFLVLAELIFGHVSVVRDYGVRPISLDTRATSEIDGKIHASSRQRLAFHH